MSQILGKYGVYLQDFIAKIKQMTVSPISDELKDQLSRLESSRTQEATKLVNAQINEAANEIRRGGEPLITVLDVFCEVLPEIVRTISDHEMENPPLSFVLKSLVVSSISSVGALFEAYYKMHYRLANSQMDNNARERFLGTRILDYVRLLQITLWFFPVRPVVSVRKEGVYGFIEPLFKSVESDTIYRSMQTRVQKMGQYWRSQAERDKVNRGREIPR